MDIPEQSKRLTTGEFIESQRIAKELLKLHKAGWIKDADDNRARLAAVAMRIWGGTFEVETSTCASIGESTKSVN